MSSPTPARAVRATSPRWRRHSRTSIASSSWSSSRQGERSVEPLADGDGLSIANASQHLQHLRRAGLVATRRQAKCVLYHLADEAGRPGCGVTTVTERNVGEINRMLRRYFHERDDSSPWRARSFASACGKGR